VSKSHPLPGCVASGRCNLPGISLGAPPWSRPPGAGSGRGQRRASAALSLTVYEQLRKQKKRKRMTSNNCVKPIGYYIPEKSERSERIHIPCKKWDCPVCSRVLINRLLDDVRLFFEGETVRFLTLTERSTASNNKEIMKHWKRLLDNLRVYFPHIRYFWAKEFTKRGVRHLHVLINCYVPHGLLKRLWRLATEGQSDVVWVEKTVVRNAAAYMMKYMSKQFQCGGFEKGERRYGFGGGKRPKVVEWEGKEKGLIEVEIDPHFNPASKYWMGYYGENQVKYGVAYIDYMNYRLCGFLTRWRIDDMKGWHYKKEVYRGRNRWGVGKRSSRQVGFGGGSV